MNLQKGNIFYKCVSRIMSAGGGGAVSQHALGPLWADIPLGRHPCPPQQTATSADGTHPTGMHSCFTVKLIKCAILIVIDLVIIELIERKFTQKFFILEIEGKEENMLRGYFHVAIPFVRNAWKVLLRTMRWTVQNVR